MSIINKLYARFANDDIAGHDTLPDVREWERFIRALPETDDCVENAFNKYLCRQHFFSRKKRLVMDAVGFVFMIMEIPCLLLSNKHRSNKVENVVLLEKHHSVAVDDVAPEDILRDPRTLFVDNYEKKLGVLTRESKQYLLKCILKHPFQFFFHYFVCKELLTHDHFINTYSPAEVVVYVNERNVATPILKEMYVKERRKLVSFMHGEYLLNLIQGFMSYSEFYVWDESYITNFRDFLRCDIDRYTVYTPKKLQKKWHLEEVAPSFSFTYYFSNEKKEVISKVAEILHRLQDAGYKCKVRPHPRFMYNIEMMKNEFAGIEIEDPHSVTLEQSLGRTEYAVGLTTTVLFEAEVEGRKIILDDLSDNESFKLLVDRRFRLLSHDYELFSEVVKTLAGA